MTRHGKTGTRVHNTWMRMHDRCRNDRTGHYELVSRRETDPVSGYGWDTNPWVWVVKFRKVAP